MIAARLPMAIAGLLLAGCGTLAASPPGPTVDLAITVAAMPGQGSPTVGDRREWVVDIRVPVGASRPELTVELPPAAVQLAEEELSPPESVDGQMRHRRRVVVAVFEPGAHLIGPWLAQSITADGARLTGRVEALPVGVASVLPAGSESIDPALPEPPWVIPAPWWDGWTWPLAITAVATLAGLGWWWWWRRRRTTSPALPPEPPHLEARRRLAELAGRDRSDPDLARVFHFEAADIVKHFLAREFGHPARERTTTELAHLLSTHHHVSPATREALVDLLADGDNCKYAGRRPAADHYDDWLRRAATAIRSLHDEAESARRAAAAERERPA